MPLVDVAPPVPLPAPDELEPPLVLDIVELAIEVVAETVPVVVAPVPIPLLALVEDEDDDVPAPGHEHVA